jgi:hypothetical protein
MRYELEKRSGIIAIYDTEHPKFERTEGCHVDYPWVIASWTGTHSRKTNSWRMKDYQVKQAEHLYSLLNDK